MHKFFFLSFVLLFHLSSAQKYWIGGSSNSFSDPNNWANSDGGSPGAGKPIDEDVYFVEVAPVNDCFIDESISVNNIFIDNVFGGKIVQGNGNSITVNDYIQNGSSFEGANSKIVVNGQFNVSAGLFRSTSDSIFINSDILVSEISDFVNNSGTIVLEGTLSRSVDFKNNQVFENIVFNNTSTVESNKLISLNLNDTLHVNSSVNFLNGILDNGVIVIGNELTQVIHNSQFSGGNSTLHISVPYSLELSDTFFIGITLENSLALVTAQNDALSTSIGGDLTIIDGTVDLSNAFVSVLGNIYISNQGNLISSSQELEVRGTELTIEGNNFYHNNGTVRFNGLNSINIDVNQEVDFHNLSIDLSSVLNNQDDIIVSVDDTLNVNGLLTLTDGEFHDGHIKLIGSTSFLSIEPSFGGGNSLAGLIVEQFPSPRTLNLESGMYYPGIEIRDSNLVVEEIGTDKINISGDLIIDSNSDYHSTACELAVEGSLIQSGGIINKVNGSINVGEFSGSGGEFHAGSSVFSTQANLSLLGTFQFFSESATITINGDFSLDGSAEFTAPDNTLLIINDFLQTGGFFYGGSNSIDFGGNFILQAGVFQSTSGTAFIGGQEFKLNGSTSFSHNNGTLVFNSSSFTNLELGSTLTSELVDFYNLEFDLQNSIGPGNLDMLDTLKVLNDLTLSNGSLRNLAIVARNNVFHNSNFDGESVTADSYLLIEGNSNQIIQLADGRLPDVIMKMGNNVTINSTPTGTTIIEGDFEIQDGTLNVNGGGIRMRDLIFNDGFIDIGTGSLVLTRHLQLDGGVTTFSGDGSLSLRGNFTRNVGSLFDSSNGSLIFDMSGDRFIQNNGVLSLKNLRVNSSGADRELRSYHDLIVTGDLTIDGNASIELSQNVTQSFDLTLHGDLINNSINSDGAFKSSFQKRNISFNSSQNQTLSGAAAKTVFDNIDVTINKDDPGIIILESPLQINDHISFINGSITSASNNAVIFNDLATYDGLGSSNLNYIDGYVEKIFTTETSFEFPLSNKDTLGILEIKDVTTPSHFRARYNRDKSPNNQSLDESLDGIGNLKRVSGLEYWDISRVSGTNGVTLRFQWQNKSWSGIDSVSSQALSIANFGSGNWNDYDGGVYTYIDDNPGYVEISSVQNFGLFSFGTVNGENPLPITLHTFSGKYNNRGQVELWFETLSEINNSHFIIERSADGVTFNEVIRIKGAGNHSGLKKYVYLDDNPYLDKTYYRLVQFDYDGRSETFNSIYLRNDLAIFDLTPYPNPTRYNSKINLELIGFELHDYPLSFKIQSLSGKIIKKFTINNLSREVSISLDEIKSGHYILFISSQGHSFQRKFVISN